MAFGVPPSYDAFTRAYGADLVTPAEFRTKSVAASMPIASSTPVGLLDATGTAAMRAAVAKPTTALPPMIQVAKSAPAMASAPSPSPSTESEPTLIWEAADLPEDLPQPPVLPSVAFFLRPQHRVVVGPRRQALEAVTNALVLAGCDISVEGARLVVTSMSASGRCELEVAEYAVPDQQAFVYELQRTTGDKFAFNSLFMIFANHLARTASTAGLRLARSIHSIPMPSESLSPATSSSSSSSSSSFTASPAAAAVASATESGTGGGGGGGGADGLPSLPDHLASFLAASAAKTSPMMGTHRMLPSSATAPPVFSSTAPGFDPNSPVATMATAVQVSTTLSDEDLATIAEEEEHDLEEARGECEAVVSMLQSDQDDVVEEGAARILSILDSPHRSTYDVLLEKGAAGELVNALVRVQDSPGMHGLAAMALARLSLSDACAEDMVKHGAVFALASLVISPCRRQTVRLRRAAAEGLQRLARVASSMPQAVDCHVVPWLRLVSLTCKDTTFRRTAEMAANALDPDQTIPAASRDTDPVALAAEAMDMARTVADRTSASTQQAATAAATQSSSSSSSSA